MKTIFFDYPYDNIKPVRNDKTFKSDASRNFFVRELIKKFNYKRGPHDLSDFVVEEVVIRNKNREIWVIGS